MIQSKDFDNNNKKLPIPISNQELGWLYSHLDVYPEYTFADEIPIPKFNCFKDSTCVSPERKFSVILRNIYEQLIAHKLNDLDALIFRNLFRVKHELLFIIERELMYLERRISESVMNFDEKFDEQLDIFLRGGMSPTESTDFKWLLTSNPDLLDRARTFALMIKTLREERLDRETRIINIVKDMKEDKFLKISRAKRRKK